MPHLDLDTILINVHARCINPDRSGKIHRYTDTTMMLCDGFNYMSGT